MKKLTVLLILFLGLAHSARAGLEIQQITVSPLGSGDINIHAKIADGYYFEYYNHNYTIVDDTITLNLCYSPYLMQLGTFLENDFVISNININTTDFTLVVNVNYRRWDGTTYNCNSLVGSDSETLIFSTPLNAAVSLTSENFEVLENNLILFPNPTNGILEFSNHFTTKLKSIKIFDNLGRLVQITNTFNNNSINLKEFENGIYFIDFTTDKEKFSKKIVLKK